MNIQLAVNNLIQEGLIRGQYMLYTLIKPFVLIARRLELKYGPKHVTDRLIRDVLDRNVTAETIKYANALEDTRWDFIQAIMSWNPKHLPDEGDYRMLEGLIVDRSCNYDDYLESEVPE